MDKIKEVTISDKQKEYLKPYIQIDDKPVPMGYKQVTVKQRVENGFYKNGKPKFKTITTKVNGDPIYKKQTICFPIY